jgi:hypothetical protein
MPTEIIGEFGTAGAEREWIVAECELAIKHLEKVCGELRLRWRLRSSGRNMILESTRQLF